MKSEFIIPFILLVFWQSFLIAQEEERIINYDTRIEVAQDRSITVTEEIEVYAAGNIIKRGITRNLPRQRYLNDRLVRMKYTILEIQKNGEKEPYLSNTSGGDLMLYLGSRETYLRPGTYKYNIKYQVEGQIGFYEHYDEIYWNAIGNDSRFLIENASVTVVLPDAAKVRQESAYLGYSGQQKQDFTANQAGNVLYYEATRSLKPGEGFTVAVGIEKGVINKPTILNQYGSLIIILLGLTFLLPYYIYTWWRYGQDPPTPASYPRWESPDNLSAASINYIQKGWYQGKSFTASVIDLAIKGYLKIEEVVNNSFLSKKKYFDLVKLKDSSDDIPLEEQQLLDSLFKHKSRVSINGKYDSNVENTYQNHKASLSAQYSDFIWKGHNMRLLWIPILVTLAAGGLAVLIFLNNPYAAEFNMKIIISYGVAAVIGLLLYGYLIRKPTIDKLDLRARIKGFQMYLEMTEKERLNMLNPPEMSPQHFEEILPFAFALGVEHKWSEKFKTILEQAQYKPEWHNSSSPVYFSNHFGKNFSKNLSGATTKPSKSGSGSGGGGFSGGGGGGGGVGGW